MSPDLSILVPVLGRPHRVLPFMDSALAATPKAEVLFIADPDDEAELDALEEHGADFITHAGGYAAKINEAVTRTDRPYVFTAADDLHFHPGWFETALAHMVGKVQVVGTNDLCSDRVKLGFHATHFLIAREYAERPCIDGERGPFSEAYHHWFCDDELVGTATHRRRIAFATDSIVEHFHPMVDKSEDDATYRKGRARAKEDKLLFRNRRRMWR